MFGIATEEPSIESAPKAFAVLPENLKAVTWFTRLQTQWQVGMNGPVGLRYDVFLLWARDEGVKRRDRTWILEDLRLMEREFLAALR